MPNGLFPVAFAGQCVLVKLPIVIADVPASVMVDNVLCLPEQARKVDHIDVVVRDLEAEPIYSAPLMAGVGPCPSPKATIHFGDPTCVSPSEIRRINVSGTLHKQVYYVDRNDDVRHVGEDVPFRRSVELRPPLLVGAPQNIDIDFRDVDVDLTFEMMKASRVQQTANITFVLKITEDQQVFIQTCPPPDVLIGQQVLSNTGFEAFAGNVLAVWGGSNYVTGQPGRLLGGFSVGLGGPPADPQNPTAPFANPANVASLVQQIPPGAIRPGLRYEFCFFIQEVIPLLGATVDYTVEARVVFVNTAGTVINSTGVVIVQDEELTPGNWVQRCLLSSPAPEGAASGYVQIVFTPNNPANVGYVLIDDATLVVRA